MATVVDGTGNTRTAHVVTPRSRLPDRVAPVAGAAMSGGAGLQSRDARDRVMESLPRLEEHFQMARRNLRFHEDEASGRVVIAVVDADTGEIIRRIPPEQAVRMAENLQRLDGLLADEWA